MQTTHHDSGRKMGRCLLNAVRKFRQSLKLGLECRISAHKGEEQATEKWELEWWGFPEAEWKVRCVGYCRTGTNATETQIFANLEKICPWSGILGQNPTVLQHPLTQKEVLMSFKTHWPIRDLRPICQSKEEGSSGCQTAGSSQKLSRPEWFRETSLLPCRELWRSEVATW